MTKKLPNRPPVVNTRSPACADSPLEQGKVLAVQPREIVWATSRHHTESLFLGCRR